MNAKRVQLLARCIPIVATPRAATNASAIRNMHGKMVLVLSLGRTVMEEVILMTPGRAPIKAMRTSVLLGMEDAHPTPCVLARKDSSAAAVPAKAGVGRMESANALAVTAVRAATVTAVDREVIAAVNRGARIPEATLLVAEALTRVPATAEAVAAEVEQAATAQAPTVTLTQAATPEPIAVVAFAPAVEADLDQEVTQRILTPVHAAREGRAVTPLQKIG